MIENIERKPNVSVVVVVYNMPREAPRTLYSLSAGYQRHIDPDDSEVIVIDNGSNPPFDPKVIESLSGNFRLIRMDPAPPSPAQAINRGLAEARGDIIGVMIDGARIVTPGLLHFARHGARLYDKAVVATLGWYLGHDFQGWSKQCGYDQAREDALLDCRPPPFCRIHRWLASLRAGPKGFHQPRSLLRATFGHIVPRHRSFGIKQHKAEPAIRSFTPAMSGRRCFVSNITGQNWTSLLSPHRRPALRS